MMRLLKCRMYFPQRENNKITLNFTSAVMQEIKTSQDLAGSGPANGVGTNDGFLSTDNTTNCGVFCTLLICLHIDLA